MPRRRPREWPRPKYDLPLPQRLRDIGAGLVPLPVSHAVRHHFVPQLLMRRFATLRDPKSIVRLSKRTGHYEELPIREANQERFLYGAETPQGTHDNRIESFIGLTENAAGLALNRLITGDNVRDEDIFPIAFLLGLQQMRSPAALDAIGSYIERRQQREFNATVADPFAFAAFVSSRHGRPVHLEELEDRRQALMSVIERGGGLALSEKRYAALAVMVDLYIEAGGVLLRSDWHVLHANEGEFVLGDAGYARFAEVDRLPAANGLLFPLTPHACLAIIPTTAHAGGLRRFSCDADLVSTINLRTYGWSSDFIVGSSQHAVTSVRAAARRSRRSARPPRQDERVPDLVVESLNDPPAGASPSGAFSAATANA